MLMANETVAQEYCTEEIPFVYRTHENPDPEKIESLLMLQIGRASCRERV